jgi:hypothetical protein
VRPVFELTVWRTEVSDNPAQQVIEGLFPYLEGLETQTAAIMQFLKDKGIATEEQLAPYLEQARTSSGVKWRAARVRMEYLFSSESKGTETAVTGANQKGGAEDGNTKEANAKTESDVATTPKQDSEHPAKLDEHTGADAA